MAIEMAFFASSIRDAIKDKRLKSIKTDVGSIDQFTDSTNVTQNLEPEGNCEEFTNLN